MKPGGGARARWGVQDISSAATVASGNTSVVTAMAISASGVNAGAGRPGAAMSTQAMQAGMY